jgi:hypothetical protein
VAGRSISSLVKKKQPVVFSPQIPPRKRGGVSAGKNNLIKSDSLKVLTQPWFQRIISCGPWAEKSAWYIPC